MDANKQLAAAREMLAALQDAASLVPVAARLHPRDVGYLQTTILDAIAAAEAAGITPKTEG